MTKETEYRIFVNKENTLLNDIFNGNIVNINIANKKGGKIMLEKEKVILLEQLNSFKVKTEKELEELKAKDLALLVEEKVAEVKLTIEGEVIAEHESKIAKTEIKIEAINEAIADAETLEVEIETVEAEQVEAEQVEADQAVEENFENQNQF